MIHIFEQKQHVPSPRESLFAFFADAQNLERITPPQLRFEILRRDPGEVHQGMHIEYRLRLFGIPFGWKTLIESYEQNVSFVDLQLKGPYKLWRHTHTFEDDGAGTLMRDRVEYELPLGPLGYIAHALFVRRQIQQIFAFRRTFIDELFKKLG